MVVISGVLISGGRLRSLRSALIWRIA